MRKTKRDKALAATTGLRIVDLTRGHSRAYEYRVRRIGRSQYVWEKHNRG